MTGENDTALRVLAAVRAGARTNAAIQRAVLGEVAEGGYDRRIDVAIQRLRRAGDIVLARRILVRESVKGPVKDREPRQVPIQDALLPVLEAWRLRHPGPGRVIPPLRADGGKIDKGTPGPLLQTALEAPGLAREGLGWYQATRHTFASQWAMAGRPLRELQKILGHSSIAVTERYAHLAPDYWAPGVHSALQVDLMSGGEVASITRKGGAT